MGAQGCDTSVATSSSTSNWWELHSPYPNPSWSHHMMNNPWNLPTNPTSNSSCEEDISISTSFTNVSSQSGLTAVDSPPHELVESAATADLLGEAPSDNHLWSQVLLRSTLGGNNDIHSGQEECENFLLALSSKSLTNEMFEPSSDCLKKVEGSWEFSTSSPSFSTSIMDKALNNFEEPARLTNLPDMVRNWSIAPPEPYLHRQIAPNMCNIPANPSINRYLQSGTSLVKQDPHSPALYLGSGGMNSGNQNYFSCYGHGNQSSLMKSESGNGCNMGIKNSGGGEERYFYGLSEVPMPHARHFTDLISFGDCVKPRTDFQSSNTLGLKGQVAQESKKLVSDISPVKGSGRGNGVGNEGKKRKSEDSSDASFKKPKSEGSTASSTKMQIPKAKLGDRITALQQIVSPFGKTDTASVLHEAIIYIKFLHEQVQLLSTPYLKTGMNKDHTAWGGLERKEHLEGRFDLKSRGLCLVPVSCTPQVYRDNTGPDYLTPTYRGCLFR